MCTPRGNTATLTIAVPGQNIGPTFSGTAGQRVFVNVTGVTVGSSTCCSILASLKKPDGSTLRGTSTYIGTNGGYIDTATLPTAGTYTILLDAQGAATGAATVAAYDVPADAGSTQQPTQAGNTATLAIAVPGQNIAPTFSGTAGQRVFVNVTGVSVGSSTCCSILASLKKPDGSTLSGTSTYIGTNGGYIDTATLPTTGTYTIFLDAQGSATGSATVTAYDVPADSSGSTPNDGDDVTLTMTPGQNGAVTFAANADDPISVDFSDVTLGSSSCCSTLVKILKPDGSTLSGTLGYVGTGGGDIDMVTAPTTGSYTVSLDPQAAASGTIKITLHPPKPTTSWYMDSVDYDTLYDLGYGLGQAVLNRTKPQSALVVLDYGCQKIDDDGSTWGAVSINSNVFHSMSGLRNAIEAFGAGYYYGTASNTTAQLTIELGTNNGCRGGSDAGQVWANSVDTINNYFANHPSVDFPFARQVTALGANDIEWDFCMSDGCPTAARGWASGYSSAGNWMYDNFGACSGCQPAGSSPNGPWTQDDYWYVSWGATNALPLPEIYATNGVNAAQWERISEYGLTRHSWAMNFDGAMTQLQACTQKNACITPAGNLGNSASQGWRQLWRALNSKADYDNHVPPTGVHDRLKYSTDIKWEHG